MGSTWNKDPNTGRSLRWQAEHFDEALLENDGTFLTSRYPDCNLFDVRSIGAAMGFKNTYYVENRILPTWAPRLGFHQIPSLDDSSILYATHTNSAQAAGKMITAERVMKRTQALCDRRLIRVSSEQSL